MEKKIKYTTFRTRWGWFGFCGFDHGLIRTCLPMENAEKIRCTLLSGLDSPYKDPSYFKSYQDDIKLYYEGIYIDFRRVPVCLDGLTKFQKKVLLRLKGIKYGEIVTYAELAKMAGSPKSMRAIGQVMAKNPLPLIIPCHRVVRSDGSLGGFSAQGGIETKKRMLNLEISLEPRS